ncbi:MAG: hypothetical protein II712_05070 [Erysipelotrichaceae bacterium]|nr:hypothetical protein [Erysipelotrichaceae bacterium]
MEKILEIIWKFIKNVFHALLVMMINWVVTRQVPEPFIRLFAGLRSFINLFR